MFEIDCKTDRDKHGCGLGAIVDRAAMHTAPFREIALHSHSTHGSSIT